jgi:heat shock protein HslJ
MTDGKVAAKICNRINGNYAYGNGSIKFSGMTSTRMTCPDMPFESAFNQAINEVDTVAFEKNKMILKKGKVVLMILSEPV